MKDVYRSPDDWDESIVNLLALRKKMAVAGIGWVGWRRGQGPKLTYKARSQYRDFLGERPLVPHLSFNVAADETTGSASVPLHGHGAPGRWQRPRVVVNSHAAVGRGENHEL